MNRNDNLTTVANQLAKLGTQISELQQQMAQACAPVVERIIRTESRDTHEIEHTLDHLLDCACVPDGLKLFKSLCRYYYTLNPDAAAGYVDGYRQMWEQEAGQEE